MQEIRDAADNTLGFHSPKCIPYFSVVGPYVFQLYFLNYNQSSLPGAMTTRSLSDSNESNKDNWGLVVPLTTIFTPPAGCVTPIQFSHQLTSTSCAPPFLSPVWYNAGFYSPGVCPSGYTIGCPAATFTESIFSERSHTPGESAYNCVPR